MFWLLLRATIKKEQTKNKLQAFKSAEGKKFLGSLELIPEMFSVL